MSFTYRDNNTSPVAILKDGKKVTNVYLGKTPTEAKVVSIVDEKLNEATIQQIARCLKEMTLRELFESMKDSSSKPSSDDSMMEIDAENNETFMFVPTDDNDGTERIMIGGQSGCGKTQLVAAYIKLFRKKFPAKRVFIFVRQEDQRLQGDVFETILDYSIEDQQEDIDSIVNGEITLETLKNSLCIFDDCDNIQDKKISVAIHKLMADVVTNGRKKGISCIYVTHIFKNYAQTKVITNEANKIVFFPGYGTAQIEKILHDHGGMKTKEITQLMGRVKGSRWAMWPRSNYMVCEKKMFIL